MTKYRDDVCKFGKCVNVKVCLGLCPLVKYTDGNSKSKEVLLSTLTETENLEYKNYNDEISERAEDHTQKEQRRREKLDRILSEPNTRDKFIKLALLAGFNQSEIAVHFRLHRSRICQIVKNAP